MGQRTREKVPGETETGAHTPTGSGRQTEEGEIREKGRREKSGKQTEGSGGGQPQIKRRQRTARANRPRGAHPAGPPIEGARSHVRRGTPELPGGPARVLTRLVHVSLRAAFLSELRLSPPGPLRAGPAGGWCGLRSAANRRRVPAPGVPVWLPQTAPGQSSLLRGRLCCAHFLIHR